MKIRALPIVRLGLSLLGASALSGAAAEFKIGGQTFTLPEGFEVELVAGPPIVTRPINASFDEQGRLYVTDSSGTNDKVEKQLADKPHRVLRIEDSDGDGRFDKSTVFADKLMFPEGALWLRGSLYVAAPPSIWKLTDTDGDGVADQREEWFKGGTLTGCANDLHGPYAGPDGWIYWCKGAFAEQRHRLGDGRKFTTRASHIFRSRPDGSGLEPVLTGGMDNPVGLAFTPDGERILSCTFFQHPAGGQRDGLIHAIYGGVYGKPHDVLDGHPRTGELMPVMTHLGPAAPSGLMRYASRTFGDDFRDNLFVACFNLHKITRHVLVPQGSTFTTRDSDFLVSDNTDFHPTDVIEDADGSLLVVDTGGWYKLCCPTSQLHKPDVLGAIYRIRKKDAPRIEDARGAKIVWEKLGAEDAARLLGDARPVVRNRAIARLAALGVEAVPALAQTLRKSPSVEARRNVLWALTQIDAPSARAAARAAFDDADESVRHTAAHSASVWRDTGARAQLERLLAEKSPALQRVAAEALGRFGEKMSAPPLLAQTSAEHDRVLDHSLIYALIELGDRETIAAGLLQASPQTQRTALLALDQMPGGGLKFDEVTTRLGVPDAALRLAAWWIATRHPEWGDGLAGFFRTRLATAQATTPELERALAQAAGADSIRRLLAEAVHDAALPKASRLIALRAMAQAGLKETPSAWINEVGRVLAGDDADLLAEAIATARALPLPKDRVAGFSNAFLRIGRDGGRSAEIRLAALAAVPGSLGAIDTGLFDFLREQLAPGHPPMTRGTAAGVIANVTLTRDQALALAHSLATAGPLEISRLLPAFANVPDAATGAKVLDALEQSKSLELLRADLLRAWLAKYPAELQTRGEKLLARLGVDPAKQKTHLDELSTALKDGDIRRGQFVFNNPKSGCVTCHAIGYVGGNFGPDLTRVGTIRTERDLLEALVYPSASFVRSYEPFAVVTKNAGEQLGFLRKDAAEEIVLAIGAGLEQRIARADIVELRPGTVSLMPQGYDQILTRQELADLVTFLKATR